jgi:5,10-methylene-tetrahydrofolate dehydrogenase/methenyl tetrahydrofolate cyclohydrolase
MTARVVNPGPVAAGYREEIAAQVAELAAGGRELRLIGLLSQDDGPAATYARYAVAGAQQVGIRMDVRHVAPGAVHHAIAEANVDPDVDGIFLYYPLVDRDEDRWLRELVDPRKDIEGMHSFWSRLLYENRRYVDDEQAMQAVLPCTPLAILKLLHHAGMQGTGPQAPLAGVTACVINRSEIVGRPLSAMLANDGARVFSFDVDGCQVFEPAIGRRVHEVGDCDADRSAALAQADVVITGVPSADFEKVTADEIRPGAICVNFSERANFDDSILEKASAFVPRVGPLTISMALRNAVRLATSSGRR